MKGVNLVLLLGRLGADPELKQVGSNGSQVARFSLATTEVWVDKAGQKQEKTDWHRIVVWGKLAGVCEKYLKKGSIVHVQGKVSNRSWEDEQGNKKYSTEIIANQIQFLNSGSGEKRSSQSHEPSFEGSDEDFSPNDSEDIPF